MNEENFHVIFVFSLELSRFHYLSKREKIDIF